MNVLEFCEANGEEISVGKSKTHRAFRLPDRVVSINLRNLVFVEYKGFVGRSGEKPGRMPDNGTTR
jgi:hypothetical protein